MDQSAFALFETAIGHCAIVWSAHGIIGLELPQATRAATLGRLHRRFPGLNEGMAPDAVRQAVHGVTALLAGAPVDLSAVALDLRATDEWDRSVYEAARTLRPGETCTYGEIAARLGDRARARDVGQALARNPWPIVVPCHRVTAAGGKTGGFSARGGVSTKLRLLAIESAHASSALPLFAGGH